MSIVLTPLDKRILNRLQEDIPFVSKPWSNLARELKISEQNLLKRIDFLKKKGIIRRIAATFNPRKVGFVSTLVAAQVSSGKTRNVAQRINSCPEVTHNYQRNSKYNIWFTLIAKNRDRISKIIARLKKDKNIDKLTEFPAERLFKINVNFKVKK